MSNNVLYFGLSMQCRRLKFKKSLSNQAKYVTFYLFILDFKIFRIEKTHIID